MKFHKLISAACLAFFLGATAKATLLWESDTNRGTSIFEGLEKAPGTIVLTNDPLFKQGIVYQYNTWDDTNYAKERCESRGTVATSGDFRLSYDNEYFYGWKEMWGPMPINGSWVALHQMHGYGVSGQGAPLVLRCVNGDGNLYMQNGANGVDTNFWHVPFNTNVWQSFVIHVYLDTNPAVGYVELWYNGTMQTFNNGQTRWYGPTWDNVDGVWQDSYNLLKWGVYRSGSLNGHGPASTYWTDAKIGTTYADVNPLGGGSFSMITTPASQSVPPGGVANYTITTSPLDGFDTNINLSVFGLPSDATASFSPNTITNSSSSTMTINTAGSTPLGNYPISIIGSSIVATNTNTVALTITSFTLSAPPSTTLQAGNSTNLIVTVTTNSIFSGSIALGVSGLPAGASSFFTPPTLSQSSSSTLTISATTNTAQGNYPLTILGTNAGFEASVGSSLVINGLQAYPGLLIWTNGAADTNWSSPQNWINMTGGGYGPPGVSNSVVFTNYSVATASAISPPGSGNIVAANINSIVNASFTVIAVTNFANSVNTSAVYQNIGIVPGATLMAGAMQIGGFGLYDFGANNIVNTTISGPGATLMVTDGPVVVSQGSNTSGGAHNAMLDLSGLDNFVLDGAQIKIGVEVITHAGGVVYLAKTNSLMLLNSGYTDADGSGSPYSGNPALYIGHNKEGAGQGAQLHLGIANTIAVDYVTVGRGDLNDVLNFNPAFFGDNPSVTITGTNGNTSPVGVYVIGDGSSGQAVSSSSTNDFTGGTVNALVNYLCVGRGREGANDTTTTSGFLTFSNGTITANTLVLGFLYPSGSNSFANGIVNVNGGGTLAVTTNMILGSVPGVGAGRAQGTLNINGGTVDVPGIAGGGGTSTINFNSGTLEMQPGWAATFGAIQNVSTLNIGATGVAFPALLTAVSEISSTNTVTVASNGIVSGNIIITAPLLLMAGTLSPGNEGAGAVTNSGAVVFGAGGNYDVTVDDALAGPVTGWSFLQSGGGIAIQATAANPFTIDVQTVDNPAANFNPANNYDWIIATANGITNFTASEFAINTASFQNNLGNGSFYIHTNGNSLVLSFTNNLPLSMTMNIASAGNNLIFSGANGSAGAPYSILAATNLTLPLTNWVVIASNALDSNGDFLFTNPLNSFVPQEFYQLRLQ